MAHLERDNVLVEEDAYAEERKPQLTRRYTTGVPEYTKKPIFVKKERVPISFANRKRTVFLQDEEQAPNEQRNVSSESGESSRSNALEREKQAPGSSVRPPPVTGNWLSGRRMGLGEAYSRMDDNGEFISEFKLRAAQGFRSASVSSADTAGATESRIPRSTAYLSGSSMVKSSPPKSLKEAYARAEREEQAAIDARLAIERAEMERVDEELAEREALAERERIEGEERVAQALRSVDYESESTGPRATSPSPASRPAVRPAYLEQRPSSSRSSSDGSVGSKYPPPDPVKEAEWERNRIRAEQRKERMKRILANPNPIYLSDRRGAHASKIAHAKAILERRASATEGEEIPELRPSWGLKSRRTEAWMRRILDPNDPMLATFDDVLTSNGDPKQSTAAEIPHSSIEVGPSAQPTPPSSRPSSTQPNNGSPGKSKMWDADIDFTAHSLQESTSPLLRVKPSRLDEVREREIHSLTARAVATHRLEEIRERNSEERSVLSDSSRVNGREKTPAPTKESQEVFHERTIPEEEGEHIPNTPITIFAKGHYRPSSSSSAESNQDPEQKREESFEAIRLLARKMSPGPQRIERLVEEFAKTRETQDDQEVEIGIKVPQKFEKANKTKNLEAPDAEEQKRDSRPKTVEEKPVKSSERLEGKENEKPLEERNSQFKRGGLAVDGEIKRRSTISTPPKSDVDPEERITAEAKLFDLPDNKSERNSIRAPSRSPSHSDDGKCDETPRPKADPLTLPTPKVTGAYIETPAPSTRKPRKSRSISPTHEIASQVNDVPTSPNNNDTQNNSRRSSAGRAEERTQQKSRSTSSQPDITKQQYQPRTLRPTLSNTAIPASAADDLRKIAMEEQYEDSILDEFDAMLESDATATNRMNNTIPQDPIMDLDYDERGHPLSTEERERRIERLRLDKMNQQLKNTSSSIRDARHGIERLEHQVASATATPTPVFDDHLYVHINLKIPVPRLVISTPPTQNRGRFTILWERNWKFTWLGLILFIFGLWYVAEYAMCSVYCHPKQSTRNTWHPSDPFFPYAIPTKINQWTGNIIGSNILATFGQWLDPGWGGNNGYMGASDWWLGRDGPVGIVTNREGSVFDDDEYI